MNIKFKSLSIYGVVLKQCDTTQHFIVQWTDDSTDTIEVTNLFGELTRRRPLYTGDNVIVLPEETNSSNGICYPGKIIGVQGVKLIVQLYDNKLCLASFTRCFWISDTYYRTSVELIIEGQKEKETNNNDNS